MFAVVMDLSACFPCIYDNESQRFKGKVGKV